MKSQKIIYITYRNIADLDTGDKIVSFSFLKQISEFQNLTLINVLNEGEYTSDSISLISSITKNYIFYFERERSVFNALIRSFIYSSPYTFESKSKKNNIRKLIKDFLEITNPDIIIWDHFRTMAYYDSSFSKYNNILIQHNNESKLYIQRGRDKPFLKRILFNWQANLIDKIMSFVEMDFKKCIYISSYDVNQNLMSNNSVALKKINLSFHHNKYIPETIKEFHLLFLGSLDWEPNIHGIIWFLENVFNLLPSNFKIAIVGRNPSSRILNYANDRIKIFANVKNTEDFFHKSKIFISPILMGGGINIKMLEALSYGIPIVSTTHSLRGYDDLKIINKCDEPIAFANQIIELNENWDSYFALYSKETTYFKNYQFESKMELLEVISS